MKTAILRIGLNSYNVCQERGLEAWNITTQKVTWTNIAYTLQIAMLPHGSLSLGFSEEIPDYIENLKHSMIMADEQTMAPLKDFIETLEKSDEDIARKLVARFEKDARKG